MPDVMHCGALLDSADAAVHVHRPDVIELCQRHDLDADWVAWIRYEVVDMPLLRFGVYLPDEKGHRHLEGCTHTRWDDPGHAACTRIAMREVDVALRGELPAWWKPNGDRADA